MPLTAKELEEHNRVQRAYYSRPDLKPRMRPTASPYLKRQLTKLIKFCGLDQQERILEIGCGMGRYTLLLAEQGYRVEGLDLSPILLDKLRELNHDRFNIPLYCADLVERPLNLQQTFDSIIGFFMLHHLHDLEASFHALTHYLRPGGQIAFIEPNPFCPLYYAQIALTPGMTWAGEKGLLNMTQRRLASAAQQAGFINFRFEHFGILPPFLANQRFGSQLEDWIERKSLARPALAFELIGAQIPE